MYSINYCFNARINIIHELFDGEFINSKSEAIDINKTNSSKEYDICHYWYFLDNNFNYKPYLCNGCYDLMQKAVNFNDVTIVSVKGSFYRMHFWYMSKDDATNIMNNSDLSEKSGLL